MIDVTVVSSGLFGLSWDSAKKLASGKYPLPVRRDAWQDKGQYVLRDEYGKLRLMSNDEGVPTLWFEENIIDTSANDWVVGPAMGVAK